MPRQLESLNLYFEDFSLGDHFVTPTRPITDAEITAYAELSSDFHPIHTDEEVAAAGPFGTRVAQGMLTLAIASGLETSLFGAATELRLLAFYGIDRVRLFRPVYLGDEIRVVGEVVQLTPKDEGRGLVGLDEQIENQDGEAVASLLKLFLYERRS